MEVIWDGHRINYITAGEGEALVLIPGHMQPAQDWDDAGYSHLLNDHFRVIMMDPLGYGEGDKPHTPATYTFAARAEQLEAVLDAEAVDAAHLWGYSFGSQIAEAFARLRPVRTRSIVLGGTLPGLKGVHRRNLFEKDLDVYRSGDLDRVWNEIYPSMPEEVRLRWRPHNDPFTCAASLEGSFEPLAVESDPMPLPMLCYVGTDEFFWERAREVTETAGGRFYPVQGADHGGAFRRAEEVVAEVLPFLGR